MYRFRSSDITNDKFLAAVEKHGKVIIDKYKNMDILELQEIIYHSELTENMYNNLMFALTVADSFTLPITKSEASILFFVLQVNYAYIQRETKIQIRNVSQANMYYEQSGGHFREIMRENEPETIYTTFKCTSTKVPFIQFMWSIPITRIIDGETKQQRICLAGAVSAPYAMLSFPDIGVQNLQVPRMYYMQLLSEGLSSGNIFSDERTIRNMTSQQMNEELCIQILSYCGFKHYYNIKKASELGTYYEFDGLVYAEISPLRNGIEDSQYLLLEDRDYNFTREDLELEYKLDVVNENRQLIDDLKIYWKKRSSTIYQFLTEAVQYIPIFKSDDFIAIWLAR